MPVGKEGGGEGVGEECKADQTHFPLTLPLTMTHLGHGTPSAIMCALHFQSNFRQLSATSHLFA